MPTHRSLVLLLSLLLDPRLVLAAAALPRQDAAPAAAEAIPAVGASAGEIATLARVSEERAQRTVRELVALGPRMGGTASGARAAEYLAAAFAEAGLEVEVLEDAPRWCHAEERWSLVAEREGPAGPERLELERAWPWGFSPSVAGSATLTTEAAAGVALLAHDAPRIGRDDPKPAVVLVDGVTTPDGSWPAIRSLRARDDNPYAVFGLARGEGESLRAWLAAGTPVTLRFELVAKIERAAPRTVLARLPARPGAPPGHLLYCAHGDSDAGGPGADDNASGEAVVLEIARALAGAVAAGELPAPPRELRFAIWGSEIHSTRVYLEERSREGADVLGVINFDQAGYGSGADQLNVEPDDLPANVALVHLFAGALAGYGGEHGFPERWATNKSLGGTDSYVFSGSRHFREALVPAITVFTSAWDKPEEHPRTPGMPGESWSERDLVAVDYDNYYHSAGDTPENTTDKEPWNMGWCARVGLVGGLRWLEQLEREADEAR